MKNAFKSSLMLILALLASNAQARSWSETFTKVCNGLSVSKSSLNQIGSKIDGDKIAIMICAKMAYIYSGLAVVAGAAWLYNRYLAPVSVHRVCDAIISNDIDLVRRFINRGGDVNSCDCSQRSLLYYAIRWCREEIVKLLFAQPGININALNNSGETPLDLALRYGHTEIAELLRIAEQENARWNPLRAAWIRVAAGVGALNDEAHARMVASLD